MKKIALIEPQARGEHVYSSVRMPRLGLPMLGTILKKEGFEVTVYVGRGSSLPWSRILESDMVGISTTTSTSSEAYRIAGYLRARRLPVVIGGIHATFLPDEALGYADFVVRGEADLTFPALVRSLREGRFPEEVPGVSYRAGDRTVHNPLDHAPVDVDLLPSVDLSVFGKRLPFRSVPVMTSRGCPYNCTFCSVTPMFGRRYRYRSTESVLQELTAYRGRTIFFCDDNFTADLRRSKDLLRGILDNNIKLKGWGAQVRVEVARDEELMELMRRAGCSILYVGLESINPATLEEYNKHQSVDDIREFVRRCHEYGIRVHGMFIFGGDDDTLETFRDTVDFSLQSRIDSVQYMNLTPLPGTPLFDRLESEGRLLTRNWDLYDGHHAVFRPKRMTAHELQYGAVDAFKRFYSLRNIWKNTGCPGLHTSFYRSVGWWLVRRFEKHNRWYAGALDVLQSSSPRPIPLLYRRVSLTEARFGNRNELEAEAPFRIYISEGEGILYMHLKGFLNRLALQELHRCLKGLLPGRFFHVVVNARGLSFSSERVFHAFSVLR